MRSARAAVGADEVYLGLFATVAMSSHDSRYAALAAPMRLWLGSFEELGSHARDLAEKAKEALAKVEARPVGSVEREETMQELFHMSQFERGSLADELSGVIAAKFAKMGWERSLDSDNRGVGMEGPCGMVALLNINPPFPLDDSGERTCAQAMASLEELAIGFGLSRWASQSGVYMERGAAAAENEEIDWALARGWGAQQERSELEEAVGEGREGERGARGRGL